MVGKRILTIWLLAATLTATGGCAAGSFGGGAARKLQGTWLLTTPSGNERTVYLELIARNRVLVSHAGNLSGVYAIKGNRLVIVDPPDRRMDRLRWHVRSGNELVLFDTPPARSVGVDYMGTRMIRETAARR